MFYNDNGYWLVILVLLLFTIAYWIWHYSRATAVLQKWADENGCQITRKEYRYLRRGPFFWSTSRSQVVFYFEALDRSGLERKGFARCGSRWLGLLKDQVEVRWEE